MLRRPMGKQYDKVIKRRRRKAYIARKKAASQTKPAKPAKAKSES